MVQQQLFHVCIYIYVCVFNLVFLIFSSNICSITRYLLIGNVMSTPKKLSFVTLKYSFSKLRIRKYYLINYLAAKNASSSYFFRLLLRDRGVRVPVGAGNFFPHHHVQTGSGAHPASIPMDTRVSLPGGKAAGA
jgi:hypothetical protein